MQRARVLRQVPKMIASFGSKVLVKKRRYAASGALIRLEFEERWSEGLYLGLSDQVADGHLVYVDGTFTHTRSVRDKAKLVDAKEHQPDEDQEMPVLEDGQDPPARRLRIHGKSSPRFAAMGGNPDDVGDHGIRSPRVAVLEHNPDHELDNDDSHGVQEKIRDPEVYAQLVLKQGLKVDESVVEHLFELLPDQRISRKTDECAHAGSPPKAWASGVYRHWGVLGVRNSTKDYPLATKVVNLFIQEKLGEHACWSTFTMHRNLNLKKHRDSHNARDKASYLIPINDFKDSGLWVQLKTGEEVKEEDVVILDGDKGLVKSFQSEEGNKQVVTFDPRRWHATRRWSGNRLVLAVYNVTGLEKINSFDKEIVERLGFQLCQDSSIVEAPKIRKLLGNEGGEVQEPQQVDVELEPREAVLHIRMTIQEWNVTSARYGPDHYIEGMAERWEQINLEVDDLNSVIPAVIVKDIGRGWAQDPSLILVDDQGEELHLGSMLGMSTIRVPNFEPGDMSSDWLKVCKVHNAVVDVEEVIVLWIHRRIALRPVESDEPRADGRDPPVPEMDFRGGIPRLAMMCARDVNDLMKFVEVAEGETSGEDHVRLMKAAPENIYTPNIEDIVSKVSPENPLKVTHTVDPREGLPVVDVWVSAMEAELAALDKMAAIKRCKGPEAHRIRKDPNVVIVPSKLVFTVKPGLEPGKIRRKVRCVACGNFSGESAEELGDVYSAGATIDLVRWRSPNGGEMRIVPCVTDENLHKLVENDSSGKESIVGYILFYVDDTLAVGPPEYVHGFFDWLEATWETSGREVVSKDTTVRFLGLELSMTEFGNLKIAQPGYIDELLRKRQVTGFN
ncbi:hypothetical protein AK812_SmicGene19927 [Symbiodinium microadriaticum]|uniref:Copia protein n=1 Tax=Symbiodinium microadriaticum TaxID=2951 RepID=A0A1Q9DRB8_SYMMI|nr:hypothetical protein AK812_SmicGene19927 [Symbiodinium microadriaticum]